MSTARKDSGGLLLGVLREISLTVLGWIGALTALFVVSRPFVEDMEADLIRAGSEAAVGDFFPVTEGPFLDQWFAWLGTYLVGDPGYSIQYDEPVAEIVGEASASSLTLLATMVVVTLLLGALAFTMALRSANGGRRVLGVPAYLLGLLVPLVGLLFVVWLGYGPQVVPSELLPPRDASGTVRLGLAVVISVFVALPVVGDVIRRVHRAGAGRKRVGARALLDRGPRGFGTVECWTYLLYLVGALVVVEQLFQYPGLGFMLVESVTTNDYPLLFGLAAHLVATLAALALVRNVGWIVVRTLSGGQRPSHRPRAPSGRSAWNQGRQRPDSGRSPNNGDGGRESRNRGDDPAGAAGEGSRVGGGRQAAGQPGVNVGHQPGVARQQGVDQYGRGPPTDHGTSPGASARATSGTLWRAFASRTKTKAGAGLFALAVVFALTAIAMGPIDSQALVRPPVPGLTPAMVFHTTASMLLGTVLAVLIALVLGVVPGLLAGVADARGGTLPSVLAGLVRLPSEATLLFPISVAGLLYVVGYQPGGAPGSVEVTIGTIMGLVLAAFAFRAVYEAARDVAVPGRPTGDWIAEALLAGGARLDFVAATTVFVAADLVFLGLVPYNANETYAGVLQLTFAYQSFGVYLEGTLPLGAMLVPVLGAAPVVLGFYFLGDGMGEALWSVRSGGGGPSGAPASGGHNRHGYQPAGGENDGGTHGQGRNEPRAGGTGPPGQRSAGSSATSGVEEKQSPDSR